jgi:hypothetical protein
MPARIGRLRPRSYPNSLPGMGDRLRSIAGVALVAAACGGQTAGAQADSGSLPDGSERTDSNGPDGSTQWSPVCPSTPPALGSPCSPQQAECEYACGAPILECDPNGWLGGPSMTCEPSTNPPGCPSSSVQLQSGAPCTADGLTCVASNEGQCSCLNSGNPDGGINDTWYCEPQPGCPYPRPRIGSPCSNNMVCYYSSSGSGQICEDGVWRVTLGGA